MARGALIDFTRYRESPGGVPVIHAYRDSGGVVTIGHGFTDGSPTFRAYWLKTRGHKLRMGDTITLDEANKILGQIIDADYMPSVVRKAPSATDYQKDAACDAVFNFGTGGLKWTWADRLAKGQVSASAARLRTTAVTAGGRRLAGLVTRRADEARLMETGSYGAPVAGAPPSANRDQVREDQRMLAALGYYKGKIDGIDGNDTKAAARAFQKDHGLHIDGVVGPATRAALKTALDAKNAGRIGGGGAAVGGGGSGAIDATQKLDWHALLTAGEVAVAVGVVVLVAWLVWRNRGVILGRRTPTQ